MGKQVHTYIHNYTTETTYSNLTEDNMIKTIKETPYRQHAVRLSLLNHKKHTSSI